MPLLFLGTLALGQPSFPLALVLGWLVTFGSIYTFAAHLVIYIDPGIAGDLWPTFTTPVARYVG